MGIQEGDYFPAHTHARVIVYCMPVIEGMEATIVDSVFYDIHAFVLQSTHHVLCLLVRHRIALRRIKPGWRGLVRRHVDVRDGRSRILELPTNEIVLDRVRVIVDIVNNSL